MARRYRLEPKRSESPSPESADAIRVQLPGINLSVSPKDGEARGRIKFKRAIPWLLALFGVFGVSGATVLGYFRAFNGGRARIIAVEVKQAQTEDDVTQCKASLKSQDKRIKALEYSPNAPLVVTK